MFKSLLNFDTFIFPKIAMLVYWVGLVLIVLGTLASPFMVLIADRPDQMMLGGALGVIVMLPFAIVAILAWRVLVEFWLVIFSIRDTLREIRDQGRRSS